MNRATMCHLSALGRSFHCSRADGLGLGIALEFFKMDVLRSFMSPCLILAAL